MLSTHKTARWWGLLGHGSSILGIYASVLFFALFLMVLSCIHCVASEKRAPSLKPDSGRIRARNPALFFGLSAMANTSCLPPGINCCPSLIRCSSSGHRQPRPR